MSQSIVQFVLPDAEATKSLGFTLGQHCRPGTTILLEGDLGAGKTTLVQGLGAGLGIDEAVVSPTFTLIVEYLEGRVPLYHLDLYRLDPAEVSQLNLDSYWEGTETEPGIVAIEWAERLPYKPADYLRLVLTHQDSGRYVELIPVGDFNLDALMSFMVTSFSCS
jgi:tRNA threonylcarbamoyladenosine biosynthesis protein TsaE